MSSSTTSASATTLRLQQTQSESITMSVSTKSNTNTTTSRGRVGYSHIAIGIIIALNLGNVAQKASKDPITYVLPNLLLFTPFRNLTQRMWARVLKYDTSHIVQQQHIPELDASEYTYENLRTATNNWKSPAVVRGMFSDTTGVRLWKEPGYLSEKIGHFPVAVVYDAHPEKMDTERVTKNEYFKDVFDDDILINNNTKKYLFFPLKSRIKKGNESAIFEQNDLVREVNTMTHNDLNLDRLWQGFGTHRNYFGAQFIAGRGIGDGASMTSGSNWHCAVGNNWFVQVVGEKRWEFLDQEYSAYMQPKRDGVANVITGASNMGELQNYLPIKYVVLKAGDLLYNPDFEWHKIYNLPGLSIGCPIRESNLTIASRNNLQYYSMVVINTLLSRIGISYGLTPKD